MNADDFFIAESHPGFGTPWGVGTMSERANLALLQQLAAGPAPGGSDLETAIALADAVEADLIGYGTNGSTRLSDVESGAAILALKQILKRLGVAIDMPFRNFSGFRTYWIKEGCTGSGGWERRRQLVSSMLEPVQSALYASQARSLDNTLATAISPQGKTGWARVDEEIETLRRHFAAAQGPADYRAVGLDCVHVTEALSRQVYDPARHLRAGETEPPVDKTKIRIERFVEDALPGPDQADLRKLVRSTIEVAQSVKHQGAPSRRDAGMTADAVLLLANLLRRIDEE